TSRAGTPSPPVMHCYSSENRRLALTVRPPERWCHPAMSATGKSFAHATTMPMSVGAGVRDTDRSHLYSSRDIEQNEPPMFLRRKAGPEEHEIHPSKHL